MSTRAAPRVSLSLLERDLRKSGALRVGEHLVDAWGSKMLRFVDAGVESSQRPCSLFAGFGSVLIATFTTQHQMLFIGRGFARNCPLLAVFRVEVLPQSLAFVFTGRPGDRASLIEMALGGDPAPFVDGLTAAKDRSVQSLLDSATCESFLRSSRTIDRTPWFDLLQELGLAPAGSDGAAAPYRYEPAADGIDNTAWSLLVDGVTACQRDGRRGLVEFSSIRVHAPHRTLAQFYGALAVVCGTGNREGKRPDEDELRAKVDAIYSAVAAVVDSHYTRSHIDGFVRQIWNYPASVDVDDMLGLVAVTLSALIRDDADWEAARQCVASQLWWRPAPDWVRDWRPGGPASD